MLGLVVGVLVNFFKWLKESENEFFEDYMKMLDKYYDKYGIEVCRECGFPMRKPVVVNDGKMLLYVCSNSRCGHSFSKGVRNSLMIGKRLEVI